MKKNIALVGFGQRFFEHLKKKNNIKIIKIIVKTKRDIFFRDKNIGGTFVDIKNLDDLDGVVIATNFKSSFKYANFRIRNDWLRDGVFCKLQTRNCRNYVW